jgi:hypothetical protein
MFGKIYGRGFFIENDLGITNDEELDTCTVSELIETYPYWNSFIQQLQPFYKKIKLCTMFETSDVHPDIIEQMKNFHEVIVPFDYLKEVLKNNGINNCVSLNTWNTPIIREHPIVIPKKINSKKIIFLYVGTNDSRKNLTTLTKIFSEVAQGTDHLLIAKTNKDYELTQTKNIKIITDKIDLKALASLYNMCDYVISFTRGEGVGMPMVEGAYFGKPIIAHDQGVFRDVKKFVETEWITLPSEEIPIDYSEVPPFLHKVFWGSWWEIDENKAKEIINNLINTMLIPVSVGELIDKITILEIKLDKIKNKEALVNIQNEHNKLSTISSTLLPKLGNFKNKMRHVNEEIWDIEDGVRDCERNKTFDEDFITLARSVYFKNDERAAIKRQINELFNSEIVEEKSYTTYSK